MRCTHFTITQEGKFIGSSAVLQQAVIASTRHAADTGRPVTVMAHIDGGGSRKAVFNPDGTNERIWNIDGGTPLVPIAGQVYVNRGGGRYLCLSAWTGACPTYYNAAGRASSTTAMFRNVKSGWTFIAKGIIQYVDGTIEWDHSTDGHFEGET